MNSRGRLHVAFTMANDAGSIVLWDKFTHDRQSISLANKHMFNYKITRIGIGEDGVITDFKP